MIGCENSGFMGPVLGDIFSSSSCSCEDTQRHEKPVLLTPTQLHELQQQAVLLTPTQLHELQLSCVIKKVAVFFIF